MCAIGTLNTYSMSHQQNVQFLFSYLFLLLPYLCMKRYAKVCKSCKSHLPYLFLPFVGVSRPPKTCKSGAKGVALCKRTQKEKHVFLMSQPLGKHLFSTSR